MAYAERNHFVHNSIDFVSQFEEEERMLCRSGRNPLGFFFFFLLRCEPLN